MKHSFLVFLLLLCFLSQEAQAQPSTTLSQFYMHKAIYNPGATGVNPTIEMAAFSRREWTSFPESPTYNFLIADMPIKHRQMGVGIQLDQESIVATQKRAGNFLYSYKINMGSGTLSFGVKIGVCQTRFNASAISVKDEQDKLLNQNQINAITPTIGFGIWYAKSNLSAGFAMYDMSESASAALIPSLGQNQTVKSFSGQFNYTFALGGNWNLHFFLLDLYLPEKYNIASATTLLNYKNQLSLGSGYRSNQNLTFLANFKLNKIATALENMELGYSYDVNLSPSANYFGNSHEISLKLSLEKPKNVAHEKQKPQEISPYDL